MGGILSKENVMTNDLCFVKILLAVVFTFCGRRLHAEDRYVPADYPTIQSAIDASVEGDVVIVADGVYSGPGNN